MIFAVTIFYIFVATAFLFWNLRRRWLFNPSALFVLQQTVFFLGTLPLLNMNFPADEANLAVLSGSLLLFFMGNFLSQQMHPVSQRDAQYWRAMPIAVIEDGMFFNTMVYGLIAVSILVSAYYFKRVGYNVFLMSAGAALQGNEVAGDIATMRLNSYAGAKYFAAGYVNQFKNTLLPLLTALLFARGILKYRRFEVVLAACLAPLCIVFLLGTGQRGALFFAGFTAFAFFTASLPRRNRRKINAVLVVLFVALFGMTTLILGRHGAKVRSAADAGDLAGDMIGRFTTDNQMSATVGFRYVYNKDPQLLDGEYVHGLESLIPGHERRIALSSLVFQILFGDLRGTAPASIWGTVWYDFNWPGVVVLALLLGYLYHYLYFVFVHSPKTLGRLATFAGMYAILGLWVAGAPDAMINEGLLTLVILAGLFKLVRRIGGTDPGLGWKNACAYSAAGISGMTLAPGMRPLLRREDH